ncbi:hypothetical protein EDC39_104136 [Geothermobacter ehrlichii]|uniref:Uncharacterized protein n=1 Tax=Geothermobacter ehrlichii TaxID=213224 RepID=A0A5D3WKT8_9BACT|nr:hypothetical protein [Geothermobacter ehrlichii]TYO99012.1 hypothetical protein EDC39_104136 [Geothermobacter ehrlichii]
MHCPCPKCEATIDIAVGEISGQGGYRKCPECGDKYWLGREDFTLRVYKKDGPIYCAGCGSALGHEDLCLHCGRLYPDYVLVQKEKPAVRKARGGGFSLEFGGRSRRHAPVIVADTPAREPVNLRWLWYLAAAALVVVLVAGGIMLLQDRQVGSEYSRNYVVALYGVKSGLDQNLKVARDRAEAWRHQQGSARAVAPPIPDKEKKRLAKIRTAVAGALARLQDTPDEYAAARRRLDRLHAIYLKAHQLNMARPESPDGYEQAAGALEREFLETASGLRQEMPPDLRKALNEALPRYRNLAFLK